MNKFGGYNDYPPNWRREGDSEFWGKFLVYAFDRHETRQMLRGTEPMLSARLFFYSDDTGLAMTREYDYTTGKNRVGLYRFAACEHDMKDVPEKSRMCYHVSKCTKCGMETAVDSSD